MLAQVNIETSFVPQCGNGGFDATLLQPAGCFGIRCPEGEGVYRTGVGVRAIRECDRSLGMVNEGQNVYAMTRLQYHGVNCVRTGGFVREPTERFVGWLDPNKKQAFLNFMLDGEGTGEAAAVTPEQQGALDGVFDRALTCAVGVLGQMDDRGLQLMFRLVASSFAEWTEQPARVAIFQAAVLSRVHAWLGWRGKAGNMVPAYPCNWPLSEAGNYELVCQVVSAAWHDDHLRGILVKDLIPIEWMLAWFHS